MKNICVLGEQETTERREKGRWCKYSTIDEILKYQKKYLK